MKRLPLRKAAIMQQRGPGASLPGLCEPLRPAAAHGGGAEGQPLARLPHVPWYVLARLRSAHDRAGLLAQCGGVEELKFKSKKHG